MRLGSNAAEVAEIRAFRRLARLMLKERQRGFSQGKGLHMGRMEFIMSALLWFAAAVLLPMALLAPVQAAPAAATAPAEMLR